MRSARIGGIELGPYSHQTLNTGWLVLIGLSLLCQTEIYWLKTLPLWTRNLLVSFDFLESNNLIAASYS